MIRSLWIAKTGLEAQQTNMDVISNNLANVNTNGFKRQRAVFQDLLYQTMRQPGAQASEQTTLPSGLQLGTGVRPVSTQRVHTQGGLNMTGNDTDVAIEGKGFFQVQLPDGSTAYTRDGHFDKNENGQFMYFENLTMVPFDWDAIDRKYMTDRDISLLNEYHSEVYKRISPYLDEDEKAWLREKTMPR